MKAYVKPDMEITVFVPNEAIAGCGANSTTTYEEQTVDCIITGTDRVFYTGCTNEVKNGYLVEYNDQTYFIWTEVSSNTTGGTKPSDSATALLNAIVNAGGYTIDARNSQGWHAGVVTPTIYSIVGPSA